MEAAFNGDTAEVRAAIDNGANVDAKDENGVTALIYAATSGHLEIARLLVANGAKIELADGQGMTPLIEAVANEHLDLAEFLLAKGADINAANGDGDTPLLFAVSKDRSDIVRLLLDKSAKVDAKNKGGVAALVEAALKDYVDTARVLLEKGAKIDIQDNDGATPLITAVLHGNQDMVELLLDKGANVAIKDADGQTALDYAARGVNDGIVTAIQRAIHGPGWQPPQQAPPATPAPLVIVQAPPQRPPPKSIPWGFLLGGAAAALASIGALHWRSRGQARQDLEAQKQADMANVRALMRVDPLKACEALGSFERDYGGLHDFSGEELYSVYQARDRLKKMDPAKAARAAQDGARRAAIADVRALMQADPPKALGALLEMQRGHGDISMFIGEELGRLYEACGREQDLLGGEIRLDNSQVLGIASYWSRRGKHAAAVAIVCAEPWLSAFPTLEDGCEEVVAIYDRAGQVEDFFTKICVNKGREFLTAYAEAFLGLGRAREALRTIELVRVKDRDDKAVMAAALAADGQPELALKTLGGMAKHDWSCAEWTAYFYISLGSGRADEAREAYERIRIIRPLRRDPRRHYAMARASEQAREQGLASQIYGAFRQAGFSYKDALGRGQG
jgi:ankyrin repeat protein